MIRRYNSGLALYEIAANPLEIDMFRNSDTFIKIKVTRLCLDNKDLNFAFIDKKGGVRCIECMSLIKGARECTVCDKEVAPIFEHPIIAKSASVIGKTPQKDRGTMGTISRGKSIPYNVISHGIPYNISPDVMYSISEEGDITSQGLYVIDASKGDYVICSVCRSRVIWCGKAKISMCANCRRYVMIYALPLQRSSIEGIVVNNRLEANRIGVRVLSRGRNSEVSLVIDR